jgi:energy-coupling factor transporter ATP-binding protein EcfA2
MGFDTNPLAEFSFLSTNGKRQQPVTVFDTWLVKYKCIANTDVHHVVTGPPGSGRSTLARLIQFFLEEALPRHLFCVQTPEIIYTYHTDTRKAFISNCLKTKKQVTIFTCRVRESAFKNETCVVYDTREFLCNSLLRGILSTDYKKLKARGFRLICQGSSAPIKSKACPETASLCDLFEAYTEDDHTGLMTNIIESIR